MLPEKTNFDYSVVSQEQAVQLQIISARIKVRVQRTAEEMLAMGADLQEAKRVCKEDGKLFEDWCGSSECPISWATAKRLMAITAELGNKKDHSDLFRQSFMVLAHATQTRDEDIRQALLEHIEQEAEDGKKITQQEITALKKALVAEQNRVKDLEGEVFDAKSLISGYKAERDEAEDAKMAAVKSRDKVIKELMDKDAEIKRQKAMIDDHLQEMRDAEEVYREQLIEMREQIAEEERNRPMTDAEVSEKEKRLKALEEQERECNRSLKVLEKDIRDKQDELDKVARDSQLWRKVVTDFYAAAVKFHQEAVLLMGSAQALRDIPITDELHGQIQTVISEAEKVAKELRDAISL